MSIEHTTVGGEPVRLIALPAYNEKARAAWKRFCLSDTIFGLDIESNVGELGAYSPDTKTRLIQFGSKTEAWALNPNGPWRPHIIKLLQHRARRFVSHNASFDTVRVWFEFGIELGDRSIDTLPMASLIWPGNTAPGGRGLKALCDLYIDNGLSDADHEREARFVDLYTATKPRKTRLLPLDFEPGVSTCRKAKTRTTEKCLNVSSPRSLCGLCEEHYLARKETKPVKDVMWGDIPLTDPTYLRYGCLDALYVRRLLDILAVEVKRRSMGTLSKTEQRVKRSMTALSVRGMRVDAEWTWEVLTETESEFYAAEDIVAENTGGLKARSPKLKGWFLDRGMRVTSLDKDHLPDLILAAAERDDEPELSVVLDALAEVSRLGNLLTNLRTIHRHGTEGDGYVHPNINTLQAHTGRMSATDPAVQTLAKVGDKGKKLRGCFIARDGHVLIGADYDSQEVRIAAALSRDPALLRIVLEGLNQHELTAASIFPTWVSKAESKAEYAKAKTLDFAQQYGAMPKKIAATLGVSVQEATVLWQKWRYTYAGLVEWSDRLAAQPYIRNPFGRMVPRDKFGRSYANSNYMIQSTGRDVLGAALCRLEDAGWAPYFWLPIHDEMLMEVPEDRVDAGVAALTELMSTEIAGISIPAEGEVVGTRWKGLG